MTKRNRKKYPLTPYGLWVMGRIQASQSSVNELAWSIGISPCNLSRMLHGQTSGASYKPKIERILGKPPENLQLTA